MIWCTGNGRDRIARFIDEAKHTLFVQNERYQDSVSLKDWFARRCVVSKFISWPVRRMH